MRRILQYQSAVRDVDPTTNRRVRRPDATAAGGNTRELTRDELMDVLTQVRNQFDRLMDNVDHMDTMEGVDM
jgi:hypothetical protein